MAMGLWGLREEYYTLVWNVPHGLMFKGLVASRWALGSNCEGSDLISGLAFDEFIIEQTVGR